MQPDDLLKMDFDGIQQGRRGTDHALYRVAPSSISFPGRVEIFGHDHM